MDAVAAFSATDRADLFAEAASRKGSLSAGLIEKDFWVCWTLRHLFALKEIGPHLIFKGGTSLSKAFKVIARLSEDVDVTMNREFLGFKGDKDPAKAPSGKKRRELLEKLTAEALRYSEENLLPALRMEFESVLGKPSKSGWALKLIKEDDGSPTVLFTYPKAVAEAGVVIPEYIKQAVRIELGARGELWPATTQKITSYAAEELSNVFQAPSCDVRTLEAERTFWEKATLLHWMFHAPKGKAFQDGMSRHLSDLATLAKSSWRQKAIRHMDLLKAVAEHKRLFFPQAWAKYEEANPGTLHLVPGASRLEELRQDYRSMEIMFFETPAPFKDVVKTLEELESEINALHS